MESNSTTTSPKPILPAVMLDLETMSVAPDAAIIAIGAVRFDPCSRTPGAFLESDMFYCRVALKSSMAAGLRVDASTIMWWLQQELAARETVTNDAFGEALDLETALEALAQFYNGAKELWAIPASFDGTIIENAYRTIGVKPPFHYRDLRDGRTLIGLVKEMPKLDPYGIKHYALHDAVNQATLVQMANIMLGFVDAKAKEDEGTKSTQEAQATASAGASGQEPASSSEPQAAEEGRNRDDRPVSIYGGSSAECVLRDAGNDQVHPADSEIREAGNDTGC